jgi:hypothetical protein
MRSVSDKTERETGNTHGSKHGMQRNPARSPAGTLAQLTTIANNLTIIVKKLLTKIKCGRIIQSSGTRDPDT